MIPILFANFRRQIPEKLVRMKISRRLSSRVLGGRRGNLAVRCLVAVGVPGPASFSLLEGATDGYHLIRSDCCTHHGYFGGANFWCLVWKK
jgi:hypothetical protein